MTRRVALLAAVSVLATLASSNSYAQAKPAAQTPAPATPAAPAKWVPPQKGEVTVDFVQSKPTRVKGEIQTKLKIKNTSKGSIAR